MSTITAAQERVIANAVVLAATELLFTSMRKLFPCPTLAEVVTIHNGQGLRAEDRDQTGQYYVYAAGGLVGRHTASLNDRSFVVIGRKGSAGKTTYAPFGGWVIDTAYYAQPNDEKRLDCEFLYYAISSLDLSGDIISTAIPGINRTSIYQHSIPLPPREIQEATARFLKASADRSELTLPELPSPLQAVRSTVIRVKELSAKIEEARGIRDQIEKQRYHLLMAAYRQIAEDAPRKPMRVVAPLERRSVSVEAEKEYPQVAVRSFGRGTFHKPALHGSEITWQKPYLVKSGDILISNIKAWEGAIAVALSVDDGRVGSHRYLTCVPTPNVATPNFVCFHLLTPEGLLYVGEASPGSADRNRTLNMRALLDIPIPSPSYEKQMWFEKVYSQVTELKKLQDETVRELDALMPSILSRAFSGTL